MCEAISTDFKMLGKRVFLRLGIKIEPEARTFQIQPLMLC
jgi:hypothetical protein